MNQQANGVTPNSTSTGQAPSSAVLALLVSAALWGISWYPFRLLSEAGVGGIWAIITAELAAALLCLLLFWRQLFPRRKPSDSSRVWSTLKTLCIIGFLGGATNTGFILATLHGDVLRATLLLYLAPLWTLFLARWFLAEPIDLGGIGVVVMALTGAAVMMGPSAIQGQLGIGDSLGLMAGLAYAGYNVSVRHAEQIPQAQKTFAATLGSAVTAAIALLFLETPSWPATTSASVVALILGTGALLVLVVSLMQYGLMRVSATRAIVILVSELFFAAASAWWLADEVPGAREFVGGSLIIAASLIAAGVGRR
jgi:drug/metabolite transporter (DMT)-like permease